MLHTLKKLQREGFELTLIEVYEDGLVRVEDVKNAIRDDTALVSIMMANNEIGTIQPIAEIGAISPAARCDVSHRCSTGRGTYSGGCGRPE